MARTVAAALILVLLSALCSGILRQRSLRFRFYIDCMAFSLLTTYFAWQDQAPSFPPLSGILSWRELSIRIVAGSWWLFGSRVLVSIIKFAIHRDKKSREARLFSDLAAAAIYVSTTLVVLSSVFDLPVSGVLATSGVVAIVLGLALQNTLSDVFSGIAVGLEHPFRVGDRVKLNSGLEGRVSQINWRSTRIETDENDIAIIPNSVLAKAEIINRSFPSLFRQDSLELSCPETSNPEHVLECLQHATLLCPAILSAPAPIAALTHLGPTRNTYKLVYHVLRTKEGDATKSRLLRLIRRQLHYAGLLEIPSSSQSPGSGLATRLLRDMILFESLQLNQIDQLAKDLSPHRLEPNETLFDEGLTDQTLYIVASGVIEILQTREQTTRSLGFIGAGEFIGEIGLLMGAPHKARAAAKTHCLIFELSHDALAPLLQEYPSLVATLEKSARKGLAVEQREVAVHTAPDIGSGGQLLTRIKRFLGHAPQGPSAEQVARRETP